MPKYAIFLRGVNVGGVNLKMTDVAAAFTDAGFADVHTILASGNVLLESGDGPDVVRTTAQAALRDTFGYEAWVLVYDIDTVVLDELAALAASSGSEEKIARGDGVIYWQVLKNSTLDSAIGKTMGKKRYKSSTTTRNLRTLGKVLR